MLTNAFGIKLSKAQISKIIQLGGAFGSLLADLSKKAPTNVALPLDRDNSHGLVRNIPLNVINKSWKKNKWKKNCQSRKKVYFICFKWRYECCY